MQSLQPGVHCARVLVRLAADLVQFVGASLRSRVALAAENLFLRKQLALYRERQGTPRRVVRKKSVVAKLLHRLVEEGRDGGQARLGRSAESKNAGSM